MYKNVLYSCAIHTFHVHLVNRTPVTALKQTLHMLVAFRVVLHRTESDADHSGRIRSL
jgi:hypothetical protein